MLLGEKVARVVWKVAKFRNKIANTVCMHRTLLLNPLAITTYKITIAASNISPYILFSITYTEKQKKSGWDKYMFKHYSVSACFIVLSEFWANIHPLIYTHNDLRLRAYIGCACATLPIIPYFPTDKLEDGSVWGFLITWLKTSK